MSNDIEPVTTITTRVFQTFDGITHNVPEWGGYTNRGKPITITRVSVSHRVFEQGISDPEVSIRARLVKKDGTLSTQEMDTRFWTHSSAQSEVLHAELVEQYGKGVAIIAQQTWQKIYG